MVLNFLRMVALQLNELEAIEEEGVTESVRRGRPTGTGDERPGRTNCANPIAPSIFSCPAPCSRTLNPFNFCALYSMNAFTMLGVIFGLSWCIRAAAPAAIGVATEVPLMLIIFIAAGVPGSDSFRVGFVVTRRFEALCAKISLLPGATRSGFNKLSWCLTSSASTQKLRVGPREL